MAKVLDRDSKNVLLKITNDEYEVLNKSGLFDLNSEDENLDDYEFVFDKPIKASDLLKTF